MFGVVGILLGVMILTMIGATVYIRRLKIELQKELTDEIKDAKLIIIKHLDRRNKISNSPVPSAEFRNDEDLYREELEHGKSKYGRINN